MEAVITFLLEQHGIVGGAVVVLGYLTWRNGKRTERHEAECAERCEKTEQRFDRIEKAVVENRTDTRHLVDDMTEVKTDLKELVRNGKGACAHVDRASAGRKKRARKSGAASRKTRKGRR